MNKHSHSPRLAKAPAERAFSILHSRRGQVIVEAIVALSVLVVGFLGAFALLSRALYLNRVIADNYTATYLASEGIEVVKNLVDHNFLAGQPWNEGFSDGDFKVEYSTDSTPLQLYIGNTLRFDPLTNFYSYSGSEPTKFTRRIRITLVSIDEMKVASIVDWSTGLAQSSVNLEDRFFNWRP